MDRQQNQWSAAGTAQTGVSRGASHRGQGWIRVLAPLCLSFSLFTMFLGDKLCEHRLARDHGHERLGDRPFVASTCHVTGKLISAKPWLFQTWLLPLGLESILPATQQTSSDGRPKPGSPQRACRTGTECLGGELGSGSEVCVREKRSGHPAPGGAVPVHSQPSLSWLPSPLKK